MLEFIGQALLKNISENQSDSNLINRYKVIIYEEELPENSFDY